MGGIDGDGLAKDQGPRGFKEPFNLRSRANGLLGAILQNDENLKTRR